tara:strand:- start:408 stop:659 length:252 start_codon:yes stop_codon:yes gene_type:complete
MSDNKIVKENLCITDNLVVNGTIFFVENSKKLDNIDNLESYESISGNMENLTINGNLIVCEFEPNCQMIVKGNVTSNGNELLN